MFIIYSILIFCLLIFVHEFGHLISAKLCKVRVNEFALGMGPKLFSRQKGETLYSLRAIPIGGFCAMEGENEESDDPNSFSSKPAWMKALVLVAGSLMNIILAIVLVAAIIYYIGQPLSVVETVAEDAPAAVAGLQSGDKITAIGDTQIDEWGDISATLSSELSSASPGGEIFSGEPGAATDFHVTLTVERAGQEQKIETSLYYNEEGNVMIGITPAMGHSPVYFFKSFGLGTRTVFQMTGMMYSALWDLVTGKTGLDGLSGPIGIVKTVGDSVQYGFSSIVQLTALISLNLGIINLLPFPALDGGRLLFLVIRKVAGKRISDAVEAKVHLIGIILLLALMVVVTFKDVDRFILN
ncbi:MAG: site-2 protease family protein [Clostridiales Family XIII bacterium]|jgi:regulator of sigma E protease|nr:site-2 protease family protein [Clostridiales Family XIII bacterium]